MVRNAQVQPGGKWNMNADIMVGNFAESGHPILQGISALNRGVLTRKGGRCTNHLHDTLSKSGKYLRSSSELV